MVEQADIHSMVLSEDLGEQIEAVIQLRDNFANLPDKTCAWEDLYQLIHSKDNDVRWNATKALGHAFSHIPNKKQAWEDLHRLANDENIFVRWNATEALGIAFLHIPHKKPALEDLHRLMKDKHSYVRLSAVESLIAAFPYIPGNTQAWNYLGRMIRDEDINVRMSVAKGLSYVFPSISDKTKTLEYLHELIKDEDINLRAFAYYLLGKAFIYKATVAENEEDFRKELENAFEFFEKSLNESTFNNPSDFCLPFYRLFYEITFKKQEAEDEVQEYLAEARRASEGSESKEKLLEAIGYITIALREAKKAKETDLDVMKYNLDTYRLNCERALELLDMIEKKAPRATKVLRRGLPIIDKNLKESLKEIEEKAKEFCKESQHSPFKMISRSAYGYVKGLGNARYQIDAENRLNELSPLLRSMCNILPKESRGLICRQLDDMKRVDFPERVRIVESALSSIQPQIINLQEKLIERDRLIEYFKDYVINRLDNINYGVFRLKLRSENIVPILHKIQDELNKLKTIETDLKNFGFNIAELGSLKQHDFNKLNNDIIRLCGEIENEVVPKLSQTSDMQSILGKLHDLKQSKAEVWFNRVAGLSSIIGLLLTTL